MLNVQVVVEALKEVPPQIATMIIGMTPIFELRGAIPVAIGVYKMSPAEAYFWSVLGNVIPMIAIVFLLEKVSAWLSSNFLFWKKFFDWLFEHTRKKTKGKMEKYGEWGLFVLVAIPLPVTGGWTGALASFIFGISRKKSIPIIALGIMTAGIIVTLITIGAIKITI